MGSIPVTVTGGMAHHHSAYIEWTESDINIANNTSKVTFQLKLYSDGSGSSWRGQPSTAYFTVAGSQYSYGCTFDTRGAAHTETLFTHTQTFTHNADGTLSVPVSLSYTTGLSGVATLSGSGTATLSQIPRKSTATLSASSVNIGSALTITLHKAVSSFTHNIVATFGGTKYTIATKTTANSVTWTLPAGMANIIPNATSGAVTIDVSTYNGSTFLGANYYNFTAVVPNTATYQPTISAFTWTRNDGTVPASWGVLVKGKSRLNLSVTAAGAAGSTIKSYAITGPNTSISTASGTSGYLNEAGQLTFTAKVTDTRGRTATKTVTATVLDYTAPSIVSATAARCLADGTLSDDGQYVVVRIKTSVSTVGGKNSADRNYRYREANDDWNNAVTIPEDTEVVFGNDEISVDNVYEVRLSVVDAFHSVHRIITISTSYSLIDYKNGGRGIAFGKAATEDDLVDSALPISCDSWMRATDFIAPQHTVGSKGALVYSDNDTGTLDIRTAESAGQETVYKYYKFDNYGLNMIGGNVYGVDKLEAKAIELSMSTPYIDFHYGDSTADFTTRIIELQGFLSLQKKSLSINAVDGEHSIQDYVVAHDRSGSWEYWKWASGLAICISDTHCSGNFGNSAWGSVYDDDVFSTPGAYPFTFKAVPFCFAARTTADTDSYNSNFSWIAMCGGSTTKAPSFELVRGTTATIGHPYLRSIAIGRWK